MAETVPSHWTMKDVQLRLHEILMADHPLTQDQRKALKGVIEMCDVWGKLAPGFAKVLRQLDEKGLANAPCPPWCSTVTKKVTDDHCTKCKQILELNKQP